MKAILRFALAVAASAIAVSSLATILIFRDGSDLNIAGDRIVGPESDTYQEGHGWTPNILMDFDALDAFTGNRVDG